MLSSRIRVFSTGDLELESWQIAGIGKKLTIEAQNYIWLHSGESGILLAPDGVQVKSAELELKSLANLLRMPCSDDYVQAELEKYEQRKKSALPYVASDGSIIRREGYNDILYSDEMFEYFENHVYGTEGYENKGEQPIDLIYQCWLDDVYGRPGKSKFWDYLDTPEGMHNALDIIGIFFDGADLINMVISLEYGEWKESETKQQVIGAILILVNSSSYRKEMKNTIMDKSKAFLKRFGLELKEDAGIIQIKNDYKLFEGSYCEIFLFNEQIYKKQLKAQYRSEEAGRRDLSTSMKICLD